MAIKSFDTLIKLHKRRIDIIRREVRTLEEQRAQLVALSTALYEELAKEVELSTSDARMAGFFGAYSERVRKRQEAIALEIIRIDAAIEAKAAAIREEFAEQKKYEIAKQNALLRQAVKERTLAQSRFDEIANQQYMKQQESILEEQNV